MIAQTYITLLWYFKYVQVTIEICHRMDIIAKANTSNLLKLTYSWVPAWYHIDGSMQKQCDSSKLAKVLHLFALNQWYCNIVMGLTVWSFFHRQGAQRHRDQTEVTIQANGHFSILQQYQIVKLCQNKMNKRGAFKDIFQMLISIYNNVTHHFQGIYELEIN